MVYQILESIEDRPGAAIGTVEAPDVYSAAREACRRLFKSNTLPYREDGWMGQGGRFAVQEADRSHGRKFYVRVPS
jgi:hypothetical protein